MKILLKEIINRWQTKYNHEWMKEQKNKQWPKNVKSVKEWRPDVMNNWVNVRTEYKYSNEWMQKTC